MMKNKMLNILRKRLSPALVLVLGLAILPILLSSCGGGGGGGGDFIGAAIVSVRVSPGKIDTGDRTQVTIELSQVHENGITLKVVFPAGLEYVGDSALLIADGDEYPIDPAFNILADSDIYLVFYLSQAYFGEDGEADGNLTFELEATDVIKSGSIEVDADVDDPNIDNAQEFDVENPEFLGEDSADIEVEG